MQWTRWRPYGMAIVLALVLVMLGCSGDDDFILTGTWTGTMEDNVAGVGAVLLTLSQTDAQVRGTWQSTFADPTHNNGGTVSGTVSDPSITLVLSTTQPGACSFTVAAHRDDDEENRFTGTYAALDCPRTQNGRLDVTRR